MNEWHLNCFLKESPGKRRYSFPIGVQCVFFLKKNILFQWILKKDKKKIKKVLTKGIKSDRVTLTLTGKVKEGLRRDF